MAPTTRAIARSNHYAVAQEVDDSDYGSEIDDDTLTAILQSADSDSQLLEPVTPLVIESIEEYNSLPQAVHVPKDNTPDRFRPQRKTLVDENGVPFEVYVHDGPIREPSVEVEYDERNRVAFTARASPTRSDERQQSVEPEVVEDTRSPLERFRTPPKKTMSVTDLVSPAWCELQYFYSLSKYGKVKKTPAMKQGSSVHKVLEEQVHVAVPVDVETKEDRFALRIWNIIQGLRTLRATGMTRELEVWGVIEGQVINGVIDELSYTCSDEALRAQLEGEIANGNKMNELPPDQKTLDAFFAGRKAQESDTKDTTAASKARGTVYLTDIKTRGSNTVPSGEVSLRPTHQQLMLYHRLLTLLASNSVDADQVFTRYRVDPSATFSDTFISQIGGLDFNFHSSADASASTAPFNSTQDSVDEILSHNCLRSLWDLMMSEFAITMPTNQGQFTDSPLSRILRVEFRKPGTGSVIGTKTFLFDTQKLESYVASEMAWWRGERPAKGVDIEEAFKCRICEFAAGCSWRKDKVEEGVQKARVAKMKQQGVKRSAV